MMPNNQNQFSNIPIERKEQEIISTTTTTYPQQQMSSLQQPLLPHHQQQQQQQLPLSSSLSSSSSLPSSSSTFSSGNPNAISLDKNKPISGVSHKLDPSLSFELKYHTPLHHVSGTEIHDSSKPLLTTNSDIPIRQQPHSSSQMLNDIKSSASSVATSISNKASEISHQAANKINELGKDIFPSSSASTTLSSTPSAPLQAQHTLPPQVKEEVLHHQPLQHVSRADIDDQSAPVLTTPTDNLLSKQSSSLSSSSSPSSSISSTAHTVAEKLSAVGASISHQADVLMDKMMNSISSPKSSAPAVLSANSNVPLVRHTLPPQVKQEVLHHDALQHVPKNEIHDQSAPVIVAPMDTLKNSPNVISSTMSVKSSPSTAQQISSSLSSTAHVVAEKLEHMADTISHKASEVYQSLASQPNQQSTFQSMSNNHTLSQQQQIQHTLPTPIKEEVLHHAPLHHVSRADIDDQSAPVLSTPTDSLLERPGPTAAQQISSGLSTAATTVAASLPSKQQVSSTLSSTAHTVAESLPSKEQLQSSASSLSASLSSAAHVAAEKLSAVGASISSAYHDATAPSTLSQQQTKSSSPSLLSSLSSSSAPVRRYQFALPSELSSAIRLNQPQLRHVPTSDHSAPLLKTDTDYLLPKISHHNIGIPTPQHPHVQLHPGKIDLSHVQPTVPKDHQNHNFVNQKFDNTAYEVNEGGLAWSLPLQQQQQQGIDNINQQQQGFNNSNIINNNNNMMMDQQGLSSSSMPLSSSSMPLSSSSMSLSSTSTSMPMSSSSGIGKFDQGIVQQQQQPIGYSQQTITTTSTNTTTPSA